MGKSENYKMYVQIQQKRHKSLCNIDIAYMVKKCIIRLTDQGDLSININKEEMFMKKRVILSCLILIMVTVIYIVASQYISKLSNNLDGSQQDDDGSQMNGNYLIIHIDGSKVVSVEDDNTFTVVLNEDVDFLNDITKEEKYYKKRDCIKINKNDFNFPEYLENDKFKYINKEIKPTEEYEYYPWEGDTVFLTYIGTNNGIELPSQISVVEYGSRISGTVISTRVLSREPIKDNNTENIRTQECATVKISDISCAQGCTFKKGDIVELMYGSVYSDGNELKDRVLKKGDIVSYGFGRHDSERYGEYKGKDPFVMTPLRVDLEVDKDAKN